MNGLEIKIQIQEQVVSIHHKAQVQLSLSQKDYILSDSICKYQYQVIAMLLLRHHLYELGEEEYYL